MRGSDFGRGLLCSVAVLASACRSDPAPTKVDDPSALVSAPTREKSDTPFIDPETEPPPPRGGAQLEPAALEAALAAARESIAKGEIPHALVELQKCLNRLTPNATCEGLYAATLLEERKQKAWARHFLHEAVTHVDAAVPDDLLRRLGRLAGYNARFEDAMAALEVLVARGNATADDYADLAHALQSDESRKLQAIEALEKGYTLAPTRHDLLLERAILTARNDRKAAIALFEQYKTAMAGSPKQVAIADTRIATLKAELGEKPF